MTVKTIFYILLICWILFVAVYPDLKQPKGSALVRNTTESADRPLTNPMAKDFGRLHEFAYLCAASYGVKKYDELVVDSDALLGLWEIVLKEQTAAILEKAKKENVWGYSYEVYQRTKLSVENKNVFAIVYRGTDGPIDFWSNGHWITKYVPGVKTQYEFVKETTREIVESIKQLSLENTNELEVVVAGHSLGGGLAQQAAYSVDGIKTVFAYASSPVTGYYDVNKKEREMRKQGMQIYRVHERGEILAYFRRIMGVIYPVVRTNPKITEIRYNFQDLSKNIVNLHGIGPLALNLRKAWEQSSE